MRKYDLKMLNDDLVYAILFTPAIHLKRYMKRRVLYIILDGISKNEIKDEIITSGIFMADHCLP